MAGLTNFGIGATLPSGWDGRLYRRRPTAAGELTTPILHAANFALPVLSGDFGAGAVETMHPWSVFVALLEYGPASAGTQLFSSTGLPSALSPADFSPSTLHRPLPGLVGAQRFFTSNGRPFTLYVVLGSLLGAGPLLVPVNRMLKTVSISPPGATT